MVKIRTHNFIEEWYAKFPCPRDFEFLSEDSRLRGPCVLYALKTLFANILQVSYPPYLFEVFLYDEVEDTKSKATFGNGIITFHLVKRSPVQWNHLLAPESEDKDFVKRRREEAINKAHDRAKKEQEQKAADKREQEKVALREQMKVNHIQGLHTIYSRVLNNNRKYYSSSLTPL